MSEKSENLDEVIEETKEAERHLGRAKEAARRAGDRDGVREFEEEVGRVEKIGKKYEGIRTRKSG